MTVPEPRSFLSGGGVTGALMRSIDWPRTPVGPIEGWPSSLRTTISILLHSRQPMLLWWGAELTQFYNDAYLPSVGSAKHPAAMGGRGRETWQEIWNIIGPQIDEVMSRGEAVWQEDALVPILRNGEIEDVYWTYGYSPVFDEAGRIAGVLVICTETTERVLAARRAQAVLEAAEQQRAQVVRFFAEAPAAICTLRGPTLVFELANDLYCEIVGRSDLIGKTFLEALPELAGEGIDDRMRDVMASGETVVHRGVPSILDRCNHRPVRSFTSIWRPSLGPDGAFDGVSIFAFEVTEQVRAQQEAEDLTVQLERAVVSEHAARQAAEMANQAKDEFLAIVSHELRTPLTAMLGWARMLISGKVAPARRDHALAVIERNAVAQARLIDDLLDVSRIIAGNMRLHFTEFGIAPVVEAAIDSVRPALEAKGIELHLRLGLVPAPVMGDPNRLQQVIWNLLVNAVKFTHDGGRVDVTLLSEGAFVEVRVVDNGRGMRADFLPRVFDRFKQAETGRSRSQGGLGLGLAISRHLVELHHGRLEAFSEGEGRGSSFVLTLPLSLPPAGDQGAGTTGRPSFADIDELEGLRVLVVDDEEAVHARVSAVLSEHGVILIAMQNAADAFDALVQYRPDVMISDIAMPVEDGYSFIRRVRRLPPESGSATPAAAFTSYASAEDRAQALAAGYQMHIPKPAQAAELVAAVASLARIARAMK
jgi:signal transduction histidine kinase/CheY-like chemotaxis protein